MPMRLTGMYSGLDTDSVIKELVKAKSTKVDKAKKSKTKTEWKQEAWTDLNKKINSMNSYYIEEIRFMKEISLVYIDITKPMNNLSTTGLEINAKNWPTDINEMENYIKNDPINFFNLESVSDLNILMSFIMIPNFIQLKQITIDVITKFLNDAFFKFIVMIIIYLSFILLGLFILWIPFVKNLNSIIYKTKNMLSIIPKEILASLSNIDKLLDMDKSTINGNNNNNNNGHN